MKKKFLLNFSKFILILSCFFTVLLKAEFSNSSSLSYNEESFRYYLDTMTFGSTRTGLKSLFTSDHDRDWWDTPKPILAMVIPYSIVWDACLVFLCAPQTVYYGVKTLREKMRRTAPSFATNYS